MAVVHITEAEAAHDFSSVMARVRAGDAVRIESGSQTFEIVPSSDRNTRPRLLSEVLAGLERRGSNTIPDDQFGLDVEEAVRSHQHERLIDPWESF